MLTIHLQNFCTIDEIAKKCGFDFILAESWRFVHADRQFRSADFPLKWTDRLICG